jgi:hypothetical protein
LLLWLSERVNLLVLHFTHEQKIQTSFFVFVAMNLGSQSQDMHPTLRLRPGPQGCPPTH